MVFEQCLTILEVPVEAALGDAAAFGQNFDTDPGDPFFGQEIEGSAHPVLSVQRLARQAGRFSACFTGWHDGVCGSGLTACFFIH